MFWLSGSRKRPIANRPSGRAVPTSNTHRLRLRKRQHLYNMPRTFNQLYSLVDQYVPGLSLDFAPHYYTMTAIAVGWFDDQALLFAAQPFNIGTFKPLSKRHMGFQKSALIFTEAVFLMHLPKLREDTLVGKNRGQWRHQKVRCAVL